MSRRQRIDDLNDIAVPEQPALSPDSQEVVYVLRTSDAAADRNVTALWRVGTRDGDPERLTTGPADSSPGLVARRLPARVPACRRRPGPDLAAAGRRRRAEVADRAAARRRPAPVWSPDGTTIAFAAPVDLPRRREDEAEPVEGTVRSSPSASTTRPTASGSGAMSACTSTWSRSRPGSAARSRRRLGRRRAGLVARRAAARVRRCDRARHAT